MQVERLGMVLGKLLQRPPPKSLLELVYESRAVLQEGLPLRARDAGPAVSSAQEPEVVAQVAEPSAERAKLGLPVHPQGLGLKFPDRVLRLAPTLHGLRAR